MGERLPYRERHLSKSRGRKRWLIWFGGRKLELEVAIPFGHGVFGVRPGGGEVDVPFELVAFVAEGGGDQVVIVDRLDGGLVTGAIGNAPHSKRFLSPLPPYMPSFLVVLHLSPRTLLSRNPCNARALPHQ